MFSSVFALVALTANMCPSAAQAVAPPLAPPLTPGTNQKLSQAILDIFQSFEVEQRRLTIPKGQCTLCDVIMAS